MYEIKRSETNPVNFFAGDFPIATDTAIVDTGKAVRQYEPVKLVAGKLQPVVEIEGTTEPPTTTEENTAAGLYGIAADNASAGEEVVVYLTGEFFSSAIAYPEDVTEAMLKPYFRNIGIFLK